MWVWRWRRWGRNWSRKDEICERNEERERNLKFLRENWGGFCEVVKDKGV